MPQRNFLIGRVLFRLLVLTLGGCLLALRQGRRALLARAWDEWDEERIHDEPVAAPVSEEPVRKTRPRRVATALVFSSLFFAGAALSAGAGDQVRGLMEDGETSALATDTAASESTTTETATTAAPEEPAAAPETATPEAPAAPEPASTETVENDASAPRAAPVQNPESAEAPVDGESLGEPVEVDDSARVEVEPAARMPSRAATATRPARARVVRRQQARPKPLDPEVESADSATVWLNRSLPDPTPPAERLKPAFARTLAATAKRSGVDWALMLAVLRTRGALGSAPASPLALQSLANRLAQAAAGKDVWATAFGYSGRIGFADRAAALTYYHRAVGLRALVTGLEAARKSIGKRLLTDPRVSIYAGGQGDIAAGRVNVRVLVLVKYLAETFGQITVSSLISGHRVYSRPGVVSAHTYGHAADISSLGGVSITGHQEPGGVTERAVRAILLLPSGLVPRQVISLLGLGGPSFPMGDHHDHIHAGY